MKTFTEFLNEMSLRSYHYDFEDRPEREEGFRIDPKTGKRDLGNQTYTDKRYNPPAQLGISDRFSQKDKIIITHPRTFRRLEERLKNSEFDFNILLLESMGAHKISAYEYQVEEFMKSNGIPREGRITFAKNATSGHVLTPWMILHTLGHALTDFDSPTSNRIKDHVYMIIRKLDPDPWDLDVKSIGSVFQFTSASLEGQHNSTANTDELVHELIAEFLWNFRNLYGVSGTSIRIKPPFHEDAEIIKQVKYIEDEIRNMLRASIGKIIYDYT